MTEAAPRRAGTRLPFFVLLPVLFSVSALAAPEAEAPPKDHALFVGSTLMIKDGDAFRELVAANADTLTVVADGKTRALPRKDVNSVRIEPSLKLSNLVAQVDHLRTTAVKAAPTGDRWAADRMQILMDSMIGHSEETMHRAINNLEFAQSWQSVAGSYALQGAQQLAAQRNTELSNVADAGSRLRNSVHSFGPNDGTATAIEVSCEIAAPRAPRQAYALLVTEFRSDAREKPQYKVHVEPLRDLGPKPRRVSMTQAGLPPGFILGRVDVHVYADGQELATNLSEQRVDLTADDALRYLVVCYVTAHPKETLPPTPLKIGVPADFKAQVPADQLERPLYVTIAVDGTVKEVSAAPDRAVATTPYVDAAVRKFRYNPALKEGKPVESVAPLMLADYVR